MKSKLARLLVFTILFAFAAVDEITALPLFEPKVIKFTFGEMAKKYEQVEGLKDMANVRVVPDIFFDSFGARDFSKWDYYQNISGKCEIVKDPLGGENKVFKAYTWSGDNKKVRPRAEIKIDNHEKLETEYWYSWKFFIDPATDHTSASEIIGQWHTEPNWEEGETWKTDDLGAAMALQIRSGGELAFSSNIMGISPIMSGIFPEKGVWHRVTWHIKHSVTKNGYVEAWIDGKPLLPEGRIYGKTASNELGNFFKLGSYRYNYTSWIDKSRYATGKSILYFDDVAVGTSIYNINMQNGLNQMEDYLDKVLSPVLNVLMLWLNVQFV